MSVILRPKMIPSEVSKITLMAAVSVASAIRDSTGVSASIKWPNDIIINNKKISGILTEMEAEADSVKFLILGIGINVNAKISELPKGASSILEESGNRISRIELTKAILEKLEQHYMILCKEGFAPIKKEWENLSATIGRRVKAICMHKKIEGETIGIDSDGALILRLDNGFQERVLAGDIIHLR
jgi:BirA family biotin operon repressor/biotin-[acetyl-CoA-carboxylase] ligase